MYISDIHIFLWFFCSKVSNPRQRRRNGAYIGKEDLMAKQKREVQEVQEGLGLSKKLGQLVGFLRKPRQGVKASSRSLEQRVQNKGQKVVKGAK